MCDIFEYKIADGRYSYKSRRIREQEKIAKHKPTHNRSKGGEGRKPTRKIN